VLGIIDHASPCGLQEGHAFLDELEVFVERDA